LLFTDNDDLVREEREGYLFRAQNDYTSKRLWVFDYRVKDYAAFADHLERHARAKGFSKIIIPTREADAAEMAAVGFVSEARAEGFFRGETAYFLARYLRPERRESRLLNEELETLAEIQRQPQKTPGAPDPDFELRPATTADIPELAALFGAVFRSYPTPIDDPEYLALAMRLGTLFQVALKDGRIVGATAAEADPGQQHAEMTDCATHPDFRGRGLASHLLAALEKVCVARSYRCLWSLSRAGSYGMNLVFHRLGYRHGGILINNAHIGGRFEDLHLWVKYPA
jgi:putative beta-lysine N-acetyltransferase